MESNCRSETSTTLISFPHVYSLNLAWRSLLTEIHWLTCALRNWNGTWLSSNSSSNSALSDVVSSSSSAGACVTCGWFWVLKMSLPLISNRSSREDDSIKGGNERRLDGCSSPGKPTTDLWFLSNGKDECWKGDRLDQFLPDCWKDWTRLEELGKLILEDITNNVSHNVFNDWAKLFALWRAE